MTSFRFVLSHWAYMFASIFSTVSVPYSVMRCIGVLVESGIIIIFAPDSIHPDFFVLSSNF